jgi:hypothetical protein
MTWWLSAIVLFGVLTALFLVGLPAAFAFFGINIVGAWFYLGGEAGLIQLIRNGIVSITSFSLTPIPFFILMGEVLFHTGVAMKAIDAIDRLIWRVPGRLSVVAVVAGTVFSAISGSTIATTALLGSLLLPQMLKRGYHPNMAMGPIMAIGGVDMLIPPSALTVLLGSLAGISVSQLLIAGIVPGVMLSVMFVAWIVLRCVMDPSLAPAFEHEDIPAWDRWRPLIVYVFPLVLIFVVVVAAMTAGWATPTEAAAIGAVATVTIAWIYRALSWSNLMKALLGHLRHHSLHHHRRHDFRADTDFFRGDQRHGGGDQGRGVRALDRADRHDADPAAARLLHRPGEHDAHLPAVLHAAGGALRLRPGLVRRAVPHLHAARAADAALRHAAVHDEERRAEGDRDEPGLARGHPLRGDGPAGAGRRDPVPAHRHLAPEGAF